MLTIPTHAPPPFPGEILVEEFLEPMGITQAAFARHIGVSYVRLNEIVKGRRGISPDTALRFSKALGTTPDLWLNLQLCTDLYATLHGKKAAKIEAITRISAHVDPRKAACA